MAATSLGERLLATRARHQTQREQTLSIPGYDGQLRAKYRGLSYSESRQIGEAHEKLPDGAEKELRVAADTLARASLGCEAHLDGETYELPPLGLRLSQELGIDGPENDRQAVLAVFPNERAVMEQFVKVDDLATVAEGEIDEQLLGNSGAPS